MLPLALVPETVLIHVHKPPPPRGGALPQRLGSVTQLLQRSGPVPVNKHVRLGQQSLELLPPLGRLEVQLGRVLAHVTIDLEEGHVAEVRARDLEHVGAVLAQDAADGRSGDDAADLEDFDAREGSVVVRDGEGGWRGCGFDGVDAPGGDFDVGLAVGGLEELFVLEGLDACLAVLCVECLELGDGVALYGGFDGSYDVGVCLEVGLVRGEADHL
jgi:hypothetical protein